MTSKQLWCRSGAHQLCQEDGNDEKSCGCECHLPQPEYVAEHIDVGDVVGVAIEQPDMFTEPNPAEFAGDDYDHEFDYSRLTGQLKRVFDVMKDGEWRTIREIEEITGDPPASILAQLGHLRKERFGSFDVTRRTRGERSSGLYEYRVGDKGAGVPKRSPLALRAEMAEQIAANLAGALRAQAPSHPALKEYDQYVHDRRS